MAYLGFAEMQAARTKERIHIARNSTFILASPYAPKNMTIEDMWPIDNKKQNDNTEKLKKAFESLPATLPNVNVN